MTKFLRWSEEEAKKAYDLMIMGMSCSQVASSFTLDGKPASRNTIMGLVHRFTRRHGLVGVKALQPKKPARPRKPKVIVRKAKASEPKVELVFKPEEREPLWVKLLDLEAHHCRFPVGLGRGLESTYCGQNKCDESSYCEFHHWRTHVIAK